MLKMLIYFTIFIVTVQVKLLLQLLTNGIWKELSITGERLLEHKFNMNKSIQLEIWILKVIMKNNLLTIS